MLEQWDMPEQLAIKNELRYGLETLNSGETFAGATEFSKGKGLHGKFDH